jgi:methionyl-tRNA formyltransferase
MSFSRYKIIFFGTPEFASVILEKLADSEFRPFLVVTASDKPAGRKGILAVPSVKKTAEKKQIPFWQLDSLKDTGIAKKMFSLSPDLFIVAAYGLILPREILAIPKFGALNVHPSLLPKYRGAAPIQASILAGDKITGVSLMLMDEKIDHGPIIAQKKIKIKNKETMLDLSEKLSLLGANLLIDILPKWLKNRIKAKKQNHKKASFTQQIKKEHGQINWSKSAQEIEQMFRAYQPWPGIYTFFQGKKIKIITLEISKIKTFYQPGNIFLTTEKELAVMTKKNAIILKEVQQEGKNAVSGKSFLNGHPQLINAILD